MRQVTTFLKPGLKKTKGVALNVSEFRKNNLPLFVSCCPAKIAATQPCEKVDVFSHEKIALLLKLFKSCSLFPRS